MRELEVALSRRTGRVLVGERWRDVPRMEFALLTFLMRNPRRSYPRDELLRRVRGWPHGDTATVSVHVRRLRHRLEADPTQPRLIRTVWGSGYFFDPGGG